MLDIRWVRENPEALDAALAARGEPPAAERLIALDETRRTVVTRLQNLQTERNAAAKAIGQAKAQKDETRAQQMIEAVARLKQEAQDGEEDERRVSAELHDALATIPNVPLDDVPVGEDEDANAFVKEFGEKPEPAFAPKEHFDLGEALGHMDFERAAKLAGARFTVLTGPLARLERALGQFMIDVHAREHGYTEVSAPLLVRDEVLFGTAQLPKFADDQFSTSKPKDINEIGPIAVRILSDLGQFFREKEPPDDVKRDVSRSVASLYDELASDRHWLIPTAEVSLTNLVREEILDEALLPLRFTALTPCFRSEAGSAGRDTRGMLRQHQFQKVELVSIATPETALAEHERMLACAETVLQRLDLHYRIVTLSTGDMGFAARKTYDIEVWLPGQGAYREISSCSVCGDFQARRMNARYRPAGQKHPAFVHTLNGSGVAVGRALIAVLETYQQADGSVIVPEVLVPYMGGITTIGPAGPDDAAKDN